MDTPKLKFPSDGWVMGSSHKNLEKSPRRILKMKTKPFKWKICTVIKKTRMETFREDVSELKKTIGEKRKGDRNYKRYYEVKDKISKVIKYEKWRKIILQQTTTIVFGIDNTYDTQIQEPQFIAIRKHTFKKHLGSS